jgi:signal transduction histidine kinase
MFDFLSASPLTAARHRLLAPMPDAQLFALRDGGLHGYEVAGSVRLAPPVARRLLEDGPAGHVFHLADNTGEPWRLRRCAGGTAAVMWRFQSLEHSRCRLLERLRAALAPKLAAQVLHELRNPMNALSLHADLLVRTLPKTEDAVQRARAEASVQVIKTRLADLSQRQDAMVALWLSLSQPGLQSPASTVAAVLENSLQLLRGLYALHDVMLRVEDLDRITAGPELPATQNLHLVLIALLAMACESAARNPEPAREVLLQVIEGPEARLQLELGPTVDGTTLAAALGADRHDGALAGLSLLLESEGMELLQDSQQGPVRLSLPVKLLSR